MTPLSRLLLAVSLGSCGTEPVEPADTGEPEPPACTDGWTLGPDGACVCAGANTPDGCRPITADDQDADGYTRDIDCNDLDWYVNPGRSENVCNGYDDNCDGLGEEGCADADMDGVPERDDCDDHDSSRNWRAGDLDCDGVDQNCDGFDSCLRDDDMDGEQVDMSGRGDCDDSNPSIHHGAAELYCDARDQNCDGVDCCTQDDDMDGYACRDDCDDRSQRVYPGAPTPSDCRAEAVDFDCSGTIERDEICDSGL